MSVSSDQCILIAIGSFLAGAATMFVGSEEVQKKCITSHVILKHIKEDKKAIRQIMKDEIKDMKRNGQLPDFLRSVENDNPLNMNNLKPTPEEERLEFESMLAEAMELEIVKNSSLFENLRNQK